MAVIDTFNSFIANLNTARTYDDQNQTLFQAGSLDSARLESLTEASFFKVYRNFENFVEEVFLQYAEQSPTSDGTNTVSYLRPLDRDHTRSLLRSSLKFLDWNNPDTVIERAEIYLQNGFPVKSVFTTHRVQLNNYKFLRNHYAHNSDKSTIQFRKIIRQHFGVVPAVLPSLGGYLLLTTRLDATTYYLRKFFDDMETIADELKR